MYHINVSRHYNESANLGSTDGVDDAASLVARDAQQPEKAQLCHPASVVSGNV